MNNLDFLNLNSLRNYPLKDGASRVSTDSLFTIPNNLIVDMSLCSPGNNALSLYISRITSNSDNLLIEVSCTGIGSFGTFQTNLEFGYNSDLVMQPSTQFPQATGLITLGVPDNLADLPYGDFDFNLVSGALLSRVYSPANLGVNWISFSDNKGNTNTL